jgi:hypothetical protein
LWSNVDLNLNLCLGKGKCEGMEGNRHIASVGNGSKKYRQLSNAFEKSKIPDLLIDDIINQIT